MCNIDNNMAASSPHCKTRHISHITKDSSDVPWTATISACSQRGTCPLQGCLHFVFPKDYGYEVVRASDWPVGGRVSPGAQFVCVLLRVYVCACVYSCVGAEESTAAHVEVDAAVGRRPSISSGSPVGRNAGWYLCFLSPDFIFFVKVWKQWFKSLLFQTW